VRPLTDELARLAAADPACGVIYDRLSELRWARPWDSVCGAVPLRSEFTSSGLNPTHHHLSTTVLDVRVVPKSN
jgi:hypothetical protein